MFELGDRVRVQYGVMYKGHDLTNKVGIIKNLESYVEVYVPDIGILAKLFRHEIEDYEENIFDEITVEDIDQLFH